MGRKLLTYLAILAGIRVIVDGYDFMLAAPAVLIAFGVVDLADWIWGEQSTAKTPRVGATRK